MTFVNRLINKIKYKGYENIGPAYEYCTRCEANLTLQKGYDSDLPFWNCKGCGQMLINPNIDTENDIVWVCDGCGEALNLQPGFNENNGTWECNICKYINKIEPGELYVSEDEYQESLKNPYKGMNDADVVQLLLYEEIGNIDGREDIILVKNGMDNRMYVKKILKTYDVNVYNYLLSNPIDHMPKLFSVYEGENNLIIIEEYINGKTIKELIEEKTITKERAVSIAKELCKILTKLHNLENPIIHRDIKPSNVIISESDEVYLLDINVAKWYKPDEIEDTKLLGTQYYAAPEQFGYGFAASSSKADIYALGMLINVMITGKYPKEEKAKGKIWLVIEKCISLNPDDRFTDLELLTALQEI